MARYFDDYRGIVGHDLPPRGMDPNYSGPYGGMRMSAGRYQAEYGRYRARHPDEFGPPEAFVHGGRGGYAPVPERTRGRGDGGVRNLRYDRELLHDFNANSPALQRRGRYDREQRRPLPRGVSPWARPGRPDYADRGVPQAGYGEGWAWGPMPGSR